MSPPVSLPPALSHPGDSPAPSTPLLTQAAQALRQGIAAATAGLVGREQLAELIILGAVAREHLLVVGPPGTAKSAVVRRVAQALGGRYFEYLLGRFTEPSELFGPVSLEKLKQGTVETDTTGMLPESEIAFLDEVFLGSTAILNTLLGVLNERRFRRGHTQMPCPLRICVGAANGLPEDESLAAFGDRFLIHVFIDPVPDHLLDALLQGGWQADTTPVESSGGLAALDTLGAAVAQVDLSVARPALANALRTLRQGGIPLSDRRIVKAQRLIAAATVLGGRLQAGEGDLWPLLYTLPTRAAQDSARELLRPLLAQSANAHLFAAVEQVAEHPAARVARLVSQAQAWLDQTPLVGSDGQAPALVGATAILREIDANFPGDRLPAALAPLREALAGRISA